MPIDNPGLFWTGIHSLGAMDIDEHYMRRALELAARGRYGVSPNPIVGAVLVRDGDFIGDGWPPKAGPPHRRAT